MSDSNDQFGALDRSIADTAKRARLDTKIYRSHRPSRAAPEDGFIQGIPWHYQSPAHRRVISVFNLQRKAEYYGSSIGRIE